MHRRSIAVPLGMAMLSLIGATACAAEPTASQTTQTPSTAVPATASPGGAAAKLAPALTERLRKLPPDQKIRLIAMLTPGVSNERLRALLASLDGHVVQRFTIIDAAAAELPVRNVLRLAEFAEIAALELDETDVPPPS